MIDVASLVSKCELPSNILGKILSSKSVSTDTRAISLGDLFVALKGDNFDGNLYLEAAIKNGAIGCIYNKSEEANALVEDLYNIYPEVYFIGVGNTEKYFQKMAHLHLLDWRKNRKTLTIGITGSNGKTSTKELLAKILEELFPKKILYTSGNFNNHLGLPMTLLRLRQEHEICILEMGTNHPGEIKFLCELGDPEAGIITNIGQSHLEFFLEEKNVFKEKRILFDYVMLKKGTFSVDADNFFLNKLSGENLFKVGFSTAEINLRLDGSRLNFSEGMNIELSAPDLRGRHNFKNLSLCVSLVAGLFPDKVGQVIKACKTISLPENNRSQFISKNEKTFFLDAYNANPSSMNAALDMFIEYIDNSNLEIKKALFVLGDMNELGNKAPAYHFEIGKRLSELNILNVAFVGRFKHDYLNGYRRDALLFESTDQLSKEWVSLTQKYSSFFLKGSRTLHLESLMALN